MRGPFWKDLGIVTMGIGIAAATTVLGYSLPRTVTPHINYYPETAVVEKVEPRSGVVVVRNSIGVLFNYYGKEGWAEGDMVSMIMDDMDTPSNIFDDRIVQLRCAGFSSDYE